ncbi:hypothetical protein EHS25_004039 [Saitozyma podzolica]|uniref:DUF6534 domain-containing protein n=1 Tax=Saitozyma podzolica TaxID=1890683 RepID=A0A427YT78_9TREE|nr:hypothetical protein EHS25_004039 [Saitozyma podzolica]
MYITFHLFVSNFGRYSPFMEMNVLNQNYIIGLCTRLPVCGFFVHRAWRLWNRNNLVLVVLGTTLLASAVGLIGARVVSPSNIALTTSADAALEVKWTIIWVSPVPSASWTRTPSLYWSVLLLTPTSSFPASSPILTTAAIVFALIRSRTGWKQTDWMIKKCAIGAIESQVPCTAVSLLYLIIFETHSHDNLRVSLMFAPITFALALLSTLNLRVSLQRQTSSEREWSNALTDENKFSLPMSPSPLTFKPARQQSLQVGSAVVPPHSPRFDSV